MEQHLAELKSELRSLVVSSKHEMDLRTLRRDYFKNNGVDIPFGMYKYKDLNVFMREKLGDAFLFKGRYEDPVLVPIVPNSMRHVNQMVALQVTKKRGIKRQSVYENVTSIKNSSSNLEAIREPFKVLSNKSNIPDIETRKQEMHYDERITALEKKIQKIEEKVENFIMQFEDKKGSRRLNYIDTSTVESSEEKQSEKSVDFIKANGLCVTKAKCYCFICADNLPNCARNILQHIGGPKHSKLVIKLDRQHLAAYGFSASGSKILCHLCNKTMNKEYALEKHLFEDTDHGNACLQVITNTLNGVHDKSPEASHFPKDKTVLRLLSVAFISVNLVTKLCDGFFCSLCIENIGDTVESIVKHAESAKHVTNNFDDTLYFYSQAIFHRDDSSLLCKICDISFRPADVKQHIVSNSHKKLLIEILKTALKDNPDLVKPHDFTKNQEVMYSQAKLCELLLKMQKISLQDNIYCCGICNVKISEDALNVVHHVFGEKHIKKLSVLYKMETYDMASYYIVADNNDVESSKCLFCNVYFYDDISKHISKKSHIEAFGRHIASYVAKNQSLNKNMMDYRNFFHFNMVTEDYCAACVAPIPIGIYNVLQHVNGSKHARNCNYDYEYQLHFLQLQGVKQGESDAFTCNFCNVFAPTVQAALEHCRQVSHAQKFKEYIEA